MEFSGAIADAPRWAITSRRSGRALVVSVLIAMAESRREHSGFERGPPCRVAHGPGLFPHPLRGDRAYPGVRTGDHRAEPRDVCGSGAGLDPGSAATALHGLERALRHPRAFVADSPASRVSRR